MVNDILAIRLLGEEAIIGTPIYIMVNKLDDIKEKSMSLLAQHAKTENFHIIEKRVHRGLALHDSKSTKQIWIQSRVRFNYDSILSIEQTIVSINQD